MYGGIEALLLKMERLHSQCIEMCAWHVSVMNNVLESVSLKKSNLKFCTVTSTKGTHQILKNQISFAEYLIDNLLMQFFCIPICMMYLSRKILFQYFVVVVFVLLGTASPLKTFYMLLHSTKILKGLLNELSHVNVLFFSFQGYSDIRESTLL